MTTLAWFHCFAGIAGDMTLGALIDAGADVSEVRALLQRLPASGWELDVEPVLRAGVAATHVSVVAEEQGIVRTHAHIAGLIEEARFPSRLRDRALAVFNALAQAEGRLHGKPPSQVHFHEVGGLDAIVDVVGSCAALELLDVDHIHASAIATGTGMVRSAHGSLPNPPPAVVELLRGAPTYGRDVTVELTTPTGAAIVAALAAGFGPMPAMTIEATGFGAGARDIDGLPNATQVVIGTAAPVTDIGSGQPVVLLEVNVDDATGETISHALGALLDAGAHDAWVTPVMMKKGRPGHVVSALADPAIARTIAHVLTTETGSLGVRGTPLQRWPSARSLVQVDVDGLPVRIKVSPGRAKAEHDDAVRVARLRGLPLREVRERAEAAWRAQRDVHPSGGSDPDGEPA